MRNENGQVNTAESRRYSRNREVIYETLKGTTAHPDVDAIYAAVKKVLPGVGLATVYRNLRQLVEDGMVQTLETKKDCVHFDADVSEHAHFICDRCGAIKDLFIASPMTNAVEELGYRVDSEKLVFYGVCPDCLS